MKNLKKIVALLLCAVLLVAGSVAGTLAYLQSQTGAVQNTFTVGELTITLDEADTDEYGDPIAGANRVTANEYKLIPGHNYTKDPVVHVVEGSEECYLFVKVENGLAGIEASSTVDTPNIAAQMEDNGWVKLEGVDNVWYLDHTVDAVEEEEDIDVPVFGEFTVLETAQQTDLDEYKNAEINIYAYATQADGFDTAAEAWEAVFANP